MYIITRKNVVTYVFMTGLYSDWLAYVLAHVEQVILINKKKRKGEIISMRLCMELLRTGV